MNSGDVMRIFALQSERMYSISGAARKVLRGTHAAPALIIPKYAITNSGELLSRIPAASPLSRPSDSRETANALDRASSSR